ncbi:hypothetical protein DUI87_34681 [Hirundo rustica rustica]|uniref:Transforming acidic coiled-coil-containing protein C-terminal domain-containing protein n=1 Tax=Hirundo rustica rustica TaxID=333673 RepID=A0A3M0IJJ7_HIRRU|nr:hypothetical protein DUI87_34681 [Hirundo rustica rustica]
MALALRLILLLLLAVALLARNAQAAPWRAQGAAKILGEGDLDYQPTFRMGPLGDAEVMDQKSVQKEELPGGSSSSVAASAAERKEMPDKYPVTDADKARAAKPVGEGDLDYQPTFRMEPLEESEVMNQKSVQKEELPGGSSSSVAASAAERKEMPDKYPVTDADKARAAKPVREGDLDYQPTFRMEPLEESEVMDQKSVQKEELPGGSSSSVAASAAERKEMPDKYPVTDADKARAAKPVREGDLDYQPTFRMGPLEESEDAIRRMGAEIQGMPLPNGLLYPLYSWLSFANKQHRLTGLHLDLPEFLGTDLTDSTSTPHVFQTMATFLKEIHDLKVQLTSTAEKEQDYLNQLLTLKTDLEQKANELESLKEKMAKTSEEIKSKLDEREENMKNLKKQVENKTKCIEELQQENKVLKKKITAESKKTSLYEGKVNKLQFEIENMNKQHKEAVDIYQKDIETRKVNENKLHEEKEIHDLKVQLTSTAEKEQDYLNQLLTLKTDLEQKANELESLKEKMAKTSEEIKSKLDEREENMKNLKKQVENKTKCIEELQQENKVLKKKITAESKKTSLYEGKVEKMKLLYDEATMIQRETDIRCQHKITEMVALMEKHKNEYDKMVEEKDAE